MFIKGYTYGFDGCRGVYQTYASCMRSMWEEPWFAGFFWWDWYTRMPNRQPEMGFSIAGKKAENVVREWYAKEHP